MITRGLRVTHFSHLEDPAKVREAIKGTIMVTTGRVVHDLVGALHAAGLTGAGIRIAILDSGVDANHPMFGGSRVSGDDDDPYGHGTAMAALAAGGEHIHTWDPGQGEEEIHDMGVAPGAEVISIRILDENGIGEHKQMAQGVWDALEHNPHIISISAGTSQACGLDCPMRAPLEVARARNILVFAAVGNSGPKRATVSCPARHGSLVISVGAVDPHGKIPSFSSRNIRGRSGDITAPGGGDKAYVRVPTADGSYLHREYSRTGGPYTAMKGSSGPAAIAAGVGALQLEHLKDPVKVWEINKTGRLVTG